MKSFFVFLLLGLVAVTQGDLTRVKIALNRSVAEKSAVISPNCLTPDQKKTLKTAITSIKAVLVTATTVLRIAALAEKDTTIKHDLKIAAQITSSVNQELVSQLTKIAEEACGTCEQIVKAVNDSIDAIENTLTKVDPDWKNNAVFKAIVAAIQDIVNIVKAICPSKFSTHVPVKNLATLVDTSTDCLTPAQEKSLKTVITSIKTVLFTATTALRIAAIAEKNTTIKHDLKIAARVTSSVNRVLVPQLTKIANEACGTCDQIAQAVSDAVNAIENTLTKIDPDWKTSSIFKAVVKAVEDIISLVKAICPSELLKLDARLDV